MKEGFPQDLDKIELSQLAKSGLKKHYGGAAQGAYSGP